MLDDRHWHKLSLTKTRYVATIDVVGISLLMIANNVSSPFARGKVEDDILDDLYAKRYEFVFAQKPQLLLSFFIYSLTHPLFPSKHFDHTDSPAHHCESKLSIAMSQTAASSLPSDNTSTLSSLYRVSVSVCSVITEWEYGWPASSEQLGWNASVWL